MSLDVYLEADEPIIDPLLDNKVIETIWIRRNGSTVQISEEEWNKLKPGVAPVKVVTDISQPTKELYHANITHNLVEMAKVADLYHPLWHPEDIDVSKAKDLIIPLTQGIDNLRKKSDTCKRYNPPNGWGNYDALLKFAEDYLAACIKYPEANVVTSV